MVMPGAVQEEMPAAMPQGAMPPEGAMPVGAPPNTAPAELDAVLQQQAGMSPEQKKQMALQKLLKLRAAIDAMIRILQGQQQGQPPAWMQGGAAPTAAPAAVGPTGAPIGM